MWGERPSSRGIQGVGMRRDVRFVMGGGSPAFAEALDQSVVALMIEKKSAVDDLEALLSVPGVDMTQFGPADFPNSLDRPGEWQHP